MTSSPFMRSSRCPPPCDRHPFTASQRHRSLSMSHEGSVRVPGCWVFRGFGGPRLWSRADANSIGRAVAGACFWSGSSVQCMETPAFPRFVTSRSGPFLSRWGRTSAPESLLPTLRAASSTSFCIEGDATRQALRVNFVVCHIQVLSNTFFTHG